jgi:RNA polymerase sigma factor (sigma-70 family)
MTEGDADLVMRARAGDKECFAALLERHLPLLRRVCRRVLGTSDGLDDVAQEAALQALLGLDSLRNPRQFGPWLAGIGLNVARRSFRKGEAWSYDALMGGRLMSEPVEDGPGPLELVEAAELSRTIRAAVADLPPGQRAAVLLVYLSGLSYRETAAALGVEVGTVKTRLHKGRHRLQQHLRDLWKEEFMTTIDVDRELVEMRVADVRRRTVEDDKPRSVVILEEVGATRQVPIWVGNWEGDSIAMLVQKLQVPRPLTHAFAASLLRAGGVRVRHVRISQLLEETFYAQVVLEGSDGEKAVDARPSDAIALAVETGAPIYAADTVIAACEALRPTREPIATVGIGAADIVSDIVERWASELKKPIT